MTVAWGTLAARVVPNMNLWHKFVSECEEESTLTGGTSRERTRQPPVIRRKFQVAVPGDCRWGGISRGGGGIPNLALTPATAGVGRCHKFSWQVSAGLRQFGTHAQTHRSSRCRQVSLKVLAGVGRCHKQLRQVLAPSMDHPQPRRAGKTQC